MEYPEIYILTSIIVAFLNVSLLKTAKLQILYRSTQKSIKQPYIAQCNNIKIKAKEDYRNIWVSADTDEGAEEAGITFVENTYGEYLENLPSDNSYRIEDYKLLDHTLLETTETSVSGEFTFAVKATDAEQYAGEYTLNGTGDYEGWLILRRSFTLEHRNNPYWKCIELKDVPILNSEYVNVE